MTVPKDAARQLPVHLGGIAPSREPVAGCRDSGFRATPEGWPMDDTKPWHSAGFEALAEAGAAGFISGPSFGDSSIDKRLDRCATVQCRTMVCALAAGRPMRRRMERNEWRRHSSSFRIFARLVDQLELSEFLNDLAGNPERLTKMEEMREAS